MEPLVCVRSFQLSSPFPPILSSSLSLSLVRKVYCMCVCVCAHDVCLFGARPSTRSPSTTNAARTAVVCRRDGDYTQGVSRERELETSPNRRAQLGWLETRSLCSERAKTLGDGERMKKEGLPSSLFRLKDDSGEVRTLANMRRPEATFNSISSGHSEIREARRFI